MMVHPTHSFPHPTSTKNAFSGRRSRPLKRPSAAGTKEPKCWAKGGNEEGGGPKKSKDKETRGSTDTVNTAETKASSGDEPGAAIVEIDDVPREGVSCRPKKSRVRVQESDPEGCKDKSKAKEGKNSANCVEAETSCGDESRATTVEVDTIPSGEPSD